MDNAPAKAAALLAALLLASCAGASASAALPSHPAPQVLASLPSLAELRGISCLDPAYKEPASLYAYGGDADTAGALLNLGTAAAGGGTAALSFGIYSEAAAENPASVAFSLNPASGQPTPGPYWIGLADFSRQSWTSGPFSSTDDTVTPSQTGSFISTGGNLFVAVVTTAGQGCIVNSVTPSFPGSSPPPDAGALCVGPGLLYTRIEDALAVATPGAQIEFYANLGNAPYAGSALFVTQPGLTFWGMRTTDNQRPKVSGTGFNYSGIGSTPRAIFQFQPGADGCRISGLELYDAHNDSFNGAGVRVNQAKAVQVDDCLIHDCDMGVMSNGVAADQTGSLTLLECQIYSNGNNGDPGYNHNIYAGGTRLTMEGCEVFGSLTGHNVKSRAHINEIRACYIHDSSNREFDLVNDTGNTDIPDSYSLISGCVIQKAPNMNGNRGVIHFGQDIGGDHNGTLYLCNDTIITPYISPVVQLSALNAKLAMYNCIVWDAGSGQNGQTLAAVTGSAVIANAAGSHNWLSSGFSIPAGSSFDAPNMYFAAAAVNPPFVNSAIGDYHLLSAYFQFITDAGLSDAQIVPPPTGEGGAPLSILPPNVYLPDFCEAPRPAQGLIDLGAYESDYIAP